MTMCNGVLKELTVSSDDKVGWPWTLETSHLVYSHRSEWPKISIVTPSYNQGIFLEETLRSVLLQNYPNLELIVIDGGSKDESVTIIQKYASWISYWVTEEDKGQSDAINKGFQKASGEIITWINSDDLLTHGALQKAAEHFLNLPDDAGLIHGGMILFNEKTELETRFTYLKPSRESYLSGIVFSQPAAFFKKKYLDHVGYLRKELHYGMDYDLFMRLSLVSNFYPVNEVFAKYRVHSQSKSVAQTNQFIGDWKKTFVNLCKNLNWKKGLELMNAGGVFKDELDFYYPFNFKCEPVIISSIQPEKAIYFHLGHVLKDLYWTGKLEEASALMNLLENNFPKNWIKEDSRLETVCRKLKIPRFVLKSIKKVKAIFKKMDTDKK